MFHAVRLLFTCPLLIIGSLAAPADSLAEGPTETVPESPVFPTVVRQEFLKGHPSSAELRALAGRAERDALEQCRAAKYERCELAAITTLDCGDLWREQERGTVCEARAWAGPVHDGTRL